jgi:hypothetical protein
MDLLPWRKPGWPRLRRFRDRPNGGVANGPSRDYLLDNEENMQAFDELPAAVQEILRIGGTGNKPCLLKALLDCGSETEGGMVRKLTKAYGHEKI